MNKKRLQHLAGVDPHKKVKLLNEIQKMQLLAGMIPTASSTKSEQLDEMHGEPMGGGTIEPSGRAAELHKLVSQLNDAATLCDEGNLEQCDMIVARVCQQLQQFQGK